MIVELIPGVTAVIDPPPPPTIPLVIVRLARLWYAEPSTLPTWYAPGAKGPADPEVVLAMARGPLAKVSAKRGVA